MAGLTGFEPATFSVTGRRALRCSTTPLVKRMFKFSNFGNLLKVHVSFDGLLGLQLIDINRDILELKRNVLSRY